MTNEPYIPASALIKYLREYEYALQARRQEAIKNEDTQLSLILEGGTTSVEVLIDGIQEHIASNGFNKS